MSTVAQTAPGITSPVPLKQIDAGVVMDVDRMAKE